MNRSFFIFLLLSFSGSVISQPNSFSPRGIGGGGSMFFPRINPGNDNEFYVACDMSEMFHSTDFGNNWTQIHFSKLQAMNVSTYEFTSDPNVAYSNFNDGNSGYPVKTTDGGNSWHPLAGYTPGNEVYNMYANYRKKNQLIMGDYGSVLISNDGGANFSTIASDTSSAVGINLCGAFYDSLNIYVGTSQGLYYSIDGGSSFARMHTTGIPAGNVILSFSGAKAAGLTRFVCITAARADVYAGIMPYDNSGIATGVYIMDNANGTWSSKSIGLAFSNDWVMYTGMAWNDVNTIYLAGKDNALDANLVYKSADGGDTWNKVFKTTNNQNIATGWSGYQGDKNWGWGELCFGIEVAPYNSNKVMFGDYGFVHVTFDGGSNWKQAYVNGADQHAAGANTPKQQTYHSIGMENTTCWQVTWQSPSQMMSGYSDIGAIRSSDTGKSWGFTYNGMSVNSTYRIVATPSGTLFAGTSGIHDMYQSTRLKDAQLDASDGSGKINYSTDGGANWSLLHSFGHPVFWLAIDPNDSNKMYASVINHAGSGSSGGIWMTGNLSAHAASAWTQLPAPPRTEGHPASIVVLNDGKVLCSYSGRINTSGQFTASSGVFIYDPGSSSWTDVSDANMHYWTKDIVVDPNDSTQNTWYACVFTHWGSTSSGQGGLYKTTNRGTSWTKLTGTQFDRVTSITFNPQNKDQVFLTTETQGLWTCSNINNASPVFDSVSAYPFRQPERVYFNPYNSNEMWVSSFGNGMKMGLMNGTGPSSVPVFAKAADEMQVYPNPSKDLINILIPGQTGSSTLYVYNNTGQVVIQKSITPGQKQQLDIGALPTGDYTVKAGNKTAKFIKD